MDMLKESWRENFYDSENIYLYVESFRYVIRGKAETRNLSLRRAWQRDEEMDMSEHHRDSSPCRGERRFRRSKASFVCERLSALNAGLRRIACLADPRLTSDDASTCHDLSYGSLFINSPSPSLIIDNHERASGTMMNQASPPWT